MERARTLALAPTPKAFLLKPVGRYVVLRTSLHFVAPHGALSGGVLWGDPTEGDVSRMLAVTLGIVGVEGSRVAWIDARAIGRADPFTFRALAQYLGQHAGAVARRVTALAIVHADDVAGAVAAGFLRVVRLPVRSEAFTDPRRALEWLGRPEDAPLLEEVDALASAARTLPPEVRGLAAVLDSDPRATLATAATALATSTRTLQRLLADHGTTFRRELDAARVRLAQRLLRESNEGLSRVALEVGCSSSQQLAGLFRRVVGESPREWRARAKGG